MRLLFVWLLILPLALFAQRDSSKVFTQTELLWYVKKYHPVAMQSNLLLKQGAATVRQARGAFDPYVFSNMSQKQYDDKVYYSNLGSGLKIPTWYGVELKTGVDNNSGVYLNPENNVPASGLWYGGISVPLGQGLFIDKRRATLRQAQIFENSTVAEQQNVLNNLYFDATKAYWKWQKAWSQYQVYEEALELAQTRFKAVRQSFVFGDKPAIDTLEAFIQVQNRTLSRNQYKLAYQNLTLELSNFLWFENNTPLELTNELRPPLQNELSLGELVPQDTLQQLLVDLPFEHPEMKLYAFKLSSLDIDRRLKLEGLKPKANVNYNMLNEPIGTDVLNGISQQNYKWGFEFSFPLFLRKQRGDLQLTNIKINDAQFGQQQKSLELQNKLKAYYNQQLNLKQQVELYQDAVVNYGRLLQGERQKFNTGESSLFLINSREKNLIEARLQLIRLMSEFQIARIGLEWSAGRLFLQ